MTFIPVARLLPFTVTDALPFTRLADPRLTLPALSTMLPPGTAVPVAAFTVTFRTVDAVTAIVSGFAVTVVMVAIPVTVIVTVPNDAAKLPDGRYVAVIVLLPARRLVPFTVIDAMPPESVALPSARSPAENAMLPPGTVDPEAAFTVAVT